MDTQCQTEVCDQSWSLLTGNAGTCSNPLVAGRQCTSARQCQSNLCHHQSNLQQKTCCSGITMLNSGQTLCANLGVGEPCMDDAQCASDYCPADTSRCRPQTGTDTASFAAIYMNTGPFESCINSRGVSFSCYIITDAGPVPVSYTHLTLPPKRIV